MPTKAKKKANKTQPEPVDLAEMAAKLRQAVGMLLDKFPRECPHRDRCRIVANWAAALSAWAEGLDTLACLCRHASPDEAILDAEKNAEIADAVHRALGMMVRELMIVAAPVDPEAVN
jgi:hypothetical protein